MRLQGVSGRKLHMLRRKSCEGRRVLLRADVHVRVRMRMPELVRVSGHEEQVRSLRAVPPLR